MLPHNQLHISNFIINSVALEDKNHKCSPYYKGLIDATLALNRQKSIDSPGRESHTTVFTSLSVSLSSLSGRLQDLGTSCFACRKTVSIKPPYSSSTYTKATSPEEIKLEKKEATNPPEEDPLIHKEKPLKERVSEPATPPAPSILQEKTNDEKKQVNIQNLSQKFTLADKYRPKPLKDFICNRSEAIRLQAQVKYEGSDHVIFEGPPGVGKRTMIWAMLREAFGPDRVQGESIEKIQVNLEESSKHVEVNLSDVRGYEKHVIVELMKETQSKATKSSSDNCRAIILCEADKLSTDVLLYIRWVLETYKGNNKVIFCRSDVSKIEPIRSLCTLIQLLPPSNEEVVQVLEFIALQEGIHLPLERAEKIANSSKNNLRPAIRSFEACSWQSSCPFEEDQIILTGWEEDIANIAKNIVEERSPKQLYIIRGKLQTLIEHDVSPYFIFKSLVEELKKHLHPQVDAIYDDNNRDDQSVIESEDEMGTKILIQ